MPFTVWTHRQAIVIERPYDETGQPVREYHRITGYANLLIAEHPVNYKINYPHVLYYDPNCNGENLSLMRVPLTLGTDWRSDYLALILRATNAPFQPLAPPHPNA